MEAKRKSNLLILFMILGIGLAMNLFAATDPFAIFKNNFFAEAKTYAIPVLLLVTLGATGITYMQTKDWTKSLVVGGISAAILGGSATLADYFGAYDFNATIP